MELWGESFINKEKNFALELFGTKVGICSTKFTENQNVLKGKSIITMKLSQRNRIVNVKYESLTDYNKETLEPLKYICRITTEDEKTSIITVKIENKKAIIQFTSPTHKYDTGIDLPGEFFILDDNFVLDQYEIFLKKLNYPSKSTDKDSFKRQSFNILVPQTTSVAPKTKKLIVSDISEEKIKITDKDIDTYRVSVEFEDGSIIRMWVTKEDKELLRYEIPLQKATAVLK
jgi:hypothetical protein